MLRQRINPHVNICTKANPVMISHMQTPPKLQLQIHNWSEMNVRETTVFFNRSFSRAHLLSCLCGCGGGTKELHPAARLSLLLSIRVLKNGCFT